jgi:plastocyanin
MKKIYSLIIASTFAAFTMNAATINVSVGATPNSFTPSSFTAAIGDQVIWTWAGGGTHNVTSNASSVPAGAVVFASPTQASGTYSYTIAVAGSYGYACSLHFSSGMVASFTVSATSIADPRVDLLTTAYPNPFKDKLTIKYNGIQSIELINIVGDKIRTFELDAVETKTELDLSDLSAGVYFIRTYSEGNIVETKKVVKAK